MTSSPWVRYLTRHVVLAYIAVMLIIPATLILWRTFKPGFGQFLRLGQHPGGEIGAELVVTGAGHRAAAERDLRRFHVIALRAQAISR
jgi:ABC-type sulfate transport system permease subunit